jgi:hypothetical protein
MRPDFGVPAALYRSGEQHPMLILRQRKYNQTDVRTRRYQKRNAQFGQYLLRQGREM